AAVDAPWVLHADGVLGVPSGAVPGVDLSAWPPPGAAQADVADMYDLLFDRGYGYGPVFQGLKAAWTSGKDIFAEVELPESAHADVKRFGIHPALLDATMHALGLHGQGGENDEAGEGRPALPFFWEGVRLHASGSTSLRVCLSGASEDTVSLSIADSTGAPVLSVDGLTLRPVSVEQLGASGGSGALWEVAWRPLMGAGAGAGVVWSGWDEFVGGGVVSGPVVCEVGAGGVSAGAGAGAGGVVSGVRSVVGGVLGVVQEWLKDGRGEEWPLVVVTRGAVAVGGGVGVDVCQAPVWGLVRAAQAENPGRFVLVDADPGVEGVDSVALGVALG
ncbi:polyketide synthase dehydratase domain-containing protein, partial [Streptomyces atratus]|uniref:polyketide synthase dehydratase domain-containing protein n=1 Tax=Streptomyces atratus TaxID=1893 RepID=UPI00166F6832